MKRRICFTLLAFLLLLALSGCNAPVGGEGGKPTDAPPVSDAPLVYVANIKDYWNLSCKNTNAVIYKNVSGMNGLEFELVSAFKFDENELNIALEISDPSITYRAGCYLYVQEEEEPFPFYIYQCYRGMDWKKLSELRAAVTDADIKASQDFKTMKDMYLNEYTAALEQGTLPQLYRYVLGVGFNMENCSTAANVKAISLTLRGETKRYVFDNLLLDAETEFGFESVEISETLAVSDAPVYFSNEGIIDLASLDFTSPDSFTLTGLSFFEDHATVITDCSLILTRADGVTVEMKWDCKTPVPILAGETVKIHAYCADPKLAGVIEGITVKYIMVQYVSAEGHECTELIQGIYRMRQGLYDLCAVSQGVDILAYYRYCYRPGDSVAVQNY